MTAVLNQQSEHPGGPGGHSSRAINGKQSSATSGPPGPANILKELPMTLTDRPGPRSGSRHLEHLRATPGRSAVRLLHALVPAGERWNVTPARESTCRSSPSRSPRLLEDAMPTSPGPDGVDKLLRGGVAESNSQSPRL
ncbi:hypothetical protein BOG92_000360 [Streptomyces sp. WAC00263]|nr:hypothetical protein BOG92_000360 [Streptomyces sp. WAC00263]